jgi:tRNA(fMet)-specific endonuclease VapC
MRYMLDTNMCIYLLKRQPTETLVARFRSYAAGEIAVSAITLAELRVGAARTENPDRHNAAIDRLLYPLALLDFDQAAAASYGTIRVGMMARGAVIGALDRLIAAHAASRQLILVTNNVKEFKRVPGLPVEDWTRP